MLDGHLQYAHGAMVGAGGKKPEKSPRPEIKYGQLCRGQAVFFRVGTVQRGVQEIREIKGPVDKLEMGRERERKRNQQTDELTNISLSGALTELKTEWR